MVTGSAVRNLIFSKLNRIYITDIGMFIIITRHSCEAKDRASSADWLARKYKYRFRIAPLNCVNASANILFYVLVLLYNMSVFINIQGNVYFVPFITIVSALLDFYGFTLCIIILRRLNVFSFIWGFNKVLLTEYLKPHLCTDRH